ncbi:HvfA family oxazolone/thioamide-modified RiPP metallophore [Streptomyces sp. NPDC001108]
MGPPCVVRVRCGAGRCGATRHRAAMRCGAGRCVVVRGPYAATGAWAVTVRGAGAGAVRGRPVSPRGRGAGPGAHGVRGASRWGPAAPDGCGTVLLACVGLVQALRHSLFPGKHRLKEMGALVISWMGVRLA